MDALRLLRDQRRLIQLLGSRRITRSRGVEVCAQNLAPAGRGYELGERAEALHPRKDFPLRARSNAIAQRAVRKSLLLFVGMVRPFFDSPRDVGSEQDLDVLFPIAHEDPKGFRDVRVDVDSRRHKHFLRNLEIANSMNGKRRDRHAIQAIPE